MDVMLAPARFFARSIKRERGRKRERNKDTKIQRDGKGEKER